MTGIGDYRDGDIVQLLIPIDHAAQVLEDWARYDYEADLRVRRARTEGCVVIETKSVIYASYVMQWYPDVRVHFKQKRV